MNLNRQSSDQTPRKSPSERAELLRGSQPGYGSIEFAAPEPTRQTYHPIFVLSAVLLLGACIGSIINNHFSHEAIRGEWAREERHRATVRESWMLEIRQRESLREKMINETTVWQGIIGELELRWEEQRAAMSVERERWSEEQEKYEKRRQEERERDEAQRDEERRHREEEKRRRREREDRARKGMIWENVQPSFHCLKYGSREYTATIRNVPVGFDPLEECRKKPINIRGEQFYADRCTVSEEVFIQSIVAISFSNTSCQDTCKRHIVTGQFILNDEAPCRSWWTPPEDKV